MTSQRPLHLRISLIGLAAALWCLAPARSDELQEGDRLMAAFGGSPSVLDKFNARCPSGKLLAGFDLRVGVENAPDDHGVNSIQPICFTALAPAVAGPFELYPFKMGGSGWRSLRLACPGSNPVVTKIDVQIEKGTYRRSNDDGSGLREPTPYVNGIALYCGIVDRPQGRHVPGPSFFGKGSPTPSLQPTYVHTSNDTCADNLVGVGISTEASARLDSLGLICGYPVIAQGTPLKAQGRVKLPGGTTGSLSKLSMCEKAQWARARNSPAAPGLEAQCRAQQQAVSDQTSDGASSDSAGTASRPEPRREAIDESDLAIKGEAIANQDPLAMELRAEQAEGPMRTGFDIGMAVAEGHTLPGPGKQSIHDRLGADSDAQTADQMKRGFAAAVSFSVDRNKNAKLASTGAAIAEQDPAVGAARAGQRDAMRRLGFDIATGIFGDPALGAWGNTGPGPGSLGVRDSLTSPGAYRGFNAAMALHLSRDYRR